MDLNLVALICCLIYTAFAKNFLAGGSDLLSSFELKLHDAVFEALDHHERSRRALPDETWTGFIPDLHQHRDQLVLETVQVLSSSLICTNNNADQPMLLDSMHHRRKHFVSAVCGNRLSVYRLDGHKMTTRLLLSDVTNLADQAVSLTHAKLIDRASGDVALFLLVLTPKTIEVYLVKDGNLELSLSQELVNQYGFLHVFDLNGRMYSMLVKKTSSGKTKPGIFEFSVENGRISFNLVSSASLPDTSMLRLCTVDGQGHIFQVNSDQDKINLYSFGGSRIDHHQVIELPDISDFRCFRTGSTHYLAIATETSLRVMHYSRGSYKTIQTLPVMGVNSIVPVSPPTYRDETFLLVQGKDLFNDIPFIYPLLLDGLTLTFQASESNCEDALDSTQLPITLSTSNLTCLSTINPLDLSLLTSANLNDQLFLVIPSGKEALLVAIDATLEPVGNPAIKQFTQVQKRIDNFAAEAELIEKRSREFLAFSEGIVFHDSDVQLEGSWKTGTIIVPSVPIETLVDTKVDFNPEIWISGLDVIVGDLQKEMATLEAMINEFDNRLQGSIMNGTANPVEFELLTVEGSLLIEQLEATQLSLKNLNGLEFDPLVADLVRRNSERLIKSLKVVGKLTTDALEADQVNGIDVNKAVSAGNEIGVDGNLIIRGKVSIAGDVTVGGTVNEVDLSLQLLTANSIHDSVVFTHGEIVVDQLYVDGKLDGVRVNEILPNVVSNGSIATAMNEVHFDHLTVDGDIEILSGLVNDVNVLALNNSALRLNANQTLQGSVGFSAGVILRTSLNISKINGIPFEDLILKNSNVLNITMTGEKKFQSGVEVGQLNLYGRVNGHLLQNAMTLNTRQNVVGKTKFLNGFKVPTGDLNVTSVNGVDWEELRNNGLHPAILKQKELMKNVTFHNSVKVEGTFAADNFKANGEDLEHILADLVYADDDNIIITGRKTFQSLSLSEIQVDGYINGIKVLDELLTKSTPQSITGKYDFRNFVDFSSLDVKGRLNQYNLDELLGNVVRFDGDKETVKSRLLFERLQVSNQTIVNGSINGIPTDRMVLNGVDQNFTAPQKLISPDFTSFKIGGKLKSQDPLTKVNGHDLDIFERRRVTLSSNQFMRSMWKVQNATVDSLSMQTLNRLTVEQWQDSFLRYNSSTSQEIKTKGLDLDLLAVTGTISTLKALNDHSFLELSRVAGDIRKDLSFSHGIHFNQLELLKENIQVARNVNGYSLERLKNDAFYRDKTPFITGVKTFETVRVKGNVEVELINGERLIESFLHVSADQTISAPIQFVSAVTTEDLQLVKNLASLNGVPSELLFASQTLSHNTHKGDVVFDHSIDVESLHISALQGEDWNSLIASLVFVNQANRFENTITFTKNLKAGRMLDVEKLNGVNLKEFAKDIVLKDTETTITAKKVLKNLIAKQLSTNKILCDAMVPDVVGTVKNAIRLDRDEFVNGTIRFDTLRIGKNTRLSTLNSQPFPENYLTLDRDQELPASMVVDRLVMLGDIILPEGSRVNGIDLPEELRNTWMVDGEEKIHSNKVFVGQIGIMGNLSVSRKVNDIPTFSKELIELAEGGAIYGAPFVSDLVVENDVVKVELTNDIDLAELAARSLYRDKPISSNAKWSVPKVAIHHNHFLLPLEGIINDLPFNVEQLTGGNDTTADRLLKVEERKAYDAALQWHDALRNAYFKIDHLDLQQTLMLPHQVTAVSHLQLNNTSFLLIGMRAGSMIYRRSANESSYSLAGIPPITGTVTKWVPLAPNYAASLSTTATQLWRITSTDPFRIELIKNFGSDVSDITGEAIHTLRVVHNQNTTSESSTVASATGVKVYERTRPQSPPSA